jgi:signal peptidase
MLIYTILYFLSGLIFGFVKSPYSTKIFSLIKNIWKLIIPIIGIEYVRGIILDTNKKNKFVIISTTILVFLLELNINTFLKNFNLSEDCFKYISQTVIPLLATEMLSSYLCLKGSYKLSISYRLILEIIIIISPIYPDLNWFATGIIGIVFPAIIYIYYKYDYQKKDRTISRRKLKKQNPIIYIPTLLIIVLFTCFMLGLLKYEPVAIMSNSMNPLYYRGDVLVINKANNENITVGDIIIYSTDTKIIAHRVVNIIEENGEKYYQTKGDANQSVDLKLVEKDQIIGKYQFHVKYIGYPSVWLNDLFNQN